MKNLKWLWITLAVAAAGGATYFIVKKVKSKKGNTTARATGLIAKTDSTANSATTATDATTATTATTATVTGNTPIKRKGIFAKLYNRSLSGIML